MNGTPASIQYRGIGFVSPNSSDFAVGGGFEEAQSRVAGTAVVLLGSLGQQDGRLVESNPSLQIILVIAFILFSKSVFVVPAEKCVFAVSMESQQLQHHYAVR